MNDGQAYIDGKGREVKVTRGLDDTTWIVSVPGNSPYSRRRIVSPALPPACQRAVCQQNLDAYAREKGWRAA
uniref:Uncharacterized protein n=1 Tax=Candidatus Kentrum sp. FM TaxID=2126340 RepID=A0A450S6C5_9GAMM|nr:MAG: hypothetical protein BECKFM1743A_GA0114220_100478 [Candidatus Kentron sp. FM]VFJ47865.1 MAG: hypothetical protein BECKFM1743C_GA0114222_1005113 [Candidatus Kentron sp. FM]VFK07847.1 MAG: hypothetical protein BECKFM1743B_GA0114221_100528 [Candidatus Kentron sp. FM]